MKNFIYSFYGKLSAVLLLLLIILGSAQLYITYQSSMQLISAADQQININLAEHIARELEPTLSLEAPEDEIKSSIKYLMLYNPRIEIYVLNEQGSILYYFASPDKVKQDSVSLAPIEAFLSDSPKRLVLGEDPRNPGTKKPFSATTIDIGSDGKGYLYIILSSEQYNSALEMVQGSYIINTSLKVLAVILIMTAIAGLVLFGLLTRRLRTMTDKVESFEKGEYAVRLDERSRDELGQLASSFNHMADTIQSNVKELEKTDQLRRNLIANVSHDLRSPLASIQGYIETILIKEGNISEEERRQYLQVIMNNTQLLRNLVDELFDLSKLDARQVEADPEAFPIAELVQDVVLKLKPRAEKQEVEVAAHFGGNLPQVYADIGLIERVLINLLQNAIDYTGAEGKVEVNLQKESEHITIEVKDSGPGIPEEDLPHIFDRFYRGDKSRALAAGNTGLGLAIAQKILELHETEIRVKSEEGVGTRFMFSLPIA
jgi:signal transduction histidine kinase